MNRKSFYYHFRDKYDLVNWIFYVDFIERMEAGAAAAMSGICWKRSAAIFTGSVCFIRTRFR